jgi:hypothetical protein
MRTRQNSDRSTVPNLGISRGVPLPRRQERLIENARLTSNLNGNDSSQLRISNRERMAISRRTVSRLSSCEPQAPSIESLIANLELEFHLTGCKTNHMQFSNRKFSTLFRSPRRAWPLKPHFPLASSLKLSPSRTPGRPLVGG